MGVNATSVTKRRLLMAMLAAAFTGWLCLTLPTLVAAALAETLQSFVSGLVLFALFGLPVAIIASLLVGFPFAVLALRRGWTSLLAAGGSGALTGLLIALILLGWQLLTTSGSWGGSDGMLWDKGWPTPLGWRHEVTNLGQFLLAGAVSGLVARTVALGRKQA